MNFVQEPIPAVASRRPLARVVCGTGKGKAVAPELIGGPGWRETAGHSLNEVCRPIRKGLARTERVMSRMVRESSHLIRPMALYLFRRPGKRIRAALALMSARAGQADPEKAAELGAVLEMVHLASLIHDDILDGATMRRGQRSLHEVWGVNQSVLMGDYLLAWNFCILADRFPLSVMQVLTHAAREACDGEIEETAVAFRPDITEEHHLGIVARKTAALTAAACAAGGMLAGVSKSVVGELAAFGRAFGMAYQVVDDLLDFRGTEAGCGKPVGRDLVAGNFTLPVIRLCRILEGHPGRRLPEMFTRSSLANGGASRIVQLVRENGCLEYSRDRAESFTRVAMEAADRIPDKAGGPLKRLALGALERER